ncbi:hypothetical protein ACLKA6_010419 [Drosophila palustris]
MNAAKPQPVPQAQHDCSMNVSQRSQLLKMRLPKFSGKHSEFRNFMCLFESLVDDDASLTNVEKFNHLVSCLSDEALGVVKPYPLTDCNYPKALASLKSVYDNKCLIFFDTVAQSFDIPSMTKPSASSLRSMIDTVSAIYASLSSLGDEKDISNAMIIHMVMAKVDHVTKSKFEEQLDYDKLPSWEDCAKQLNRRYQYLSAEESTRDKTKSRNDVRSRNRNLLLLVLLEVISRRLYVLIASLLSFKLQGLEVSSLYEASPFLAPQV